MISGLHNSKESGTTVVVTVFPSEEVCSGIHVPTCANDPSKSDSTVTESESPESLARVTKPTVNRQLYLLSTCEILR